MNAKELTIYYAAQWRKAYGKNYTIAWTKHVPMFKRLLGFHEAQYIRQMVDSYLHHYNDSFSIKIGKPIEDFVRNMPALVAIQAAKEARQAPKEQSDFERLEEARIRAAAARKREKL